MSRYFTEDEILELLDLNEVQTREITESRWSMITETIIQYDKKFYRIEWERGLTESQEDTVFGQEAPEVFPIHEIHVEEQTQ